MARARHAKPSGLLARLFPGRTARRRAAQCRENAALHELREQVFALQAQLGRQAESVAAAEARARQAEELLTGLRGDVARLREELLWAWAEGRLPAASLSDGLQPARARVIDLRPAAGS